MLDRMQTILTYALMLSPLVERVVEMLKPFLDTYWKSLPKYTKKFITMVIAIIVAIPLYAKVGIDFIFIGILASLGSNYVHSILSLIEEYKQNIETDKTVKQVALMNAMIGGGDSDGKLDDVSNT